MDRTKKWPWNWDMLSPLLHRTRITPSHPVTPVKLMLKKIAVLATHIQACSANWGSCKVKLGFLPSQIRVCATPCCNSQILYTYIHIYIYTYMHTYTYIYTHMYIYIHTYMS